MSRRNEQSVAPEVPDTRNGLTVGEHEALAEHAKQLFDRYEPAFRCKRCGTYLLPDGIGLHEQWHEQWHEEPRR